MYGGNAVHLFVLFWFVFLNDASYGSVERTSDSFCVDEAGDTG